MKSILQDSHSVFGLLIIVGATVLAALGKMPIDQWSTTAQAIFIAFIGGHTAMAVATTFANRNTVPQATAVATAPTKDK